ncbi:hypothetical protein ORN01_21855 [Bacillus cereus]|jgi:acyl carrier protein|uniref:hypothetical protein n=1 Tax=Bacillus cereus group TaxID=86661 RepID=UPI000279A9F4|nr:MULTISPECIES: hypothetical protein [Bacillus cereus group]EJR73572.1 hypothetical protein IK9_05107 [Bacillus cereus VD166]MDA1913581.1 hypothetical protein [Bacillus cereus]MDA2659701.1 hypothetical protein [Bacillus cereus]MDZ4631617.1 hypothetical protein [Bacillus cereus]PEV50793.1 hypothetical protein CN432_09320 [Bacillus thuringiensis]
MLAKCIEEFIKDEIFMDESIDSIPGDLDLITTGVLNSLGIMKLIDYIENLKKVKFKGEDIVIDNFSSINKIVKFIDG